MNIGDKIGLRNMHGDVVEHEVVYVKGKEQREAKEVEPRVYRSREGYVRVYLTGRSESSYFTPNGTNVPDPILWHESNNDAKELLTGPERDEYIAAAKEGRDAVWPRKEKGPLDTNPKCPACNDTPSCGAGSWRWAGGEWEHRCENVHPQVGHWVVKEEPKESDPWPHYWRNGDGTGGVWKFERKGDIGTYFIEGGDSQHSLFEEETFGVDGDPCVRIPSSEAEAIIAGWKAPPEMPSAESVARAVVDRAFDWSETCKCPRVKCFDGVGGQVTNYKSGFDYAMGELVQHIAAAITADRKGRGE